MQNPISFEIDVLTEHHRCASITMNIKNFAFILLVVAKICMATNDCNFDINPICVVVDRSCVDDPSTCDEVEIEPCVCLNGMCDSDGTCICDNGFQISDKSNNRCEPHCTRDCLNGECIDPNLCLCHDGYHLSYNESEWNICHAICDADSDIANSCVNGICTAPNNCTCLDGYELSAESKFTCIPVLPVSTLSTVSSNYYVVWFMFTLILAFLLFAGCYVMIDAIKHREQAFEPAMAVNCIESC